MQIYYWHGEVHDSELDAQGIVHHANYLIYMAHARHQHLHSLGIDFIQMHRSGFDLVLISSEIHYKSSLSSGDQFIVSSQLDFISRLKISFTQTIFKKDNEHIVTTGLHVGVCVSKQTGKPIMPHFLQARLAQNNKTSS